MNIIYLHGFGSIANQNHPKVKELERLGTVKSIAPDYSKSFNEIILHVYSHCEIEQVNLIVGTSMGGWLASIISALDNIPFVAINPSLTPHTTLMKYAGQTILTHGGHFATFFEDNIRMLPVFFGSNQGLILLDEGDEMFNSKETANFARNYPDMIIEMFEGGSHQFDHMKESIGIIENFYQYIKPNHGLTND